MFSSLFNSMIERFAPILYDGKLDLGDLVPPYPDNVHRSGWNEAIEALRVLHRPHGARLDSYMDETFDWGDKGKLPYREPWIGFLHFPNDLPSWHPDAGRNDIVFENPLFRESLNSCRGIFTLSKYHCEQVRKRVEVPVSSLLHPTEFPDLTWSPERFDRNEKRSIVQLGFFMRRMHAVYMLPSDRYHKVLLRPNNDKVDAFMAVEKEMTLKGVDIDYDSVETISFLPNDAYDRLLSENIALTYLYNASANNVVLECIARSTPLLVNPLPPVVEYLGEGYPFYFSDLEEAARKLEDDDLILRTHLYLKNHPFREKFTYDYFVESLKDSDIYRHLP